MNKPTFEWAWLLFKYMVWVPTWTCLQTKGEVAAVMAEQLLSAEGSEDQAHDKTHHPVALMIVRSHNTNTTAADRAHKSFQQC